MQLDVPIDQACQQYEHKQQLVAQEITKAIRADIAHTFKDGVILGLSRIGGYTLGSFLSPIAVEKGLTNASGTLAKIRGLSPITFAELEEINRMRRLTRQELDTELALAQKLLKEAVGKGEVPVAMTPEGIQIPMPKSGQVFRESEGAVQGGTKGATSTRK